MSKNDIINILRDYKNKFAKQYGILALGIFGSVARDEARKDSDLDIYIKTAMPDPFILVHIKEDVEKLVHLKVDIVRIREKMNPLLKSRIEKEGVYV
jgi:uncharacterized protein